jgi:hypothetical protein
MLNEPTRVRLGTVTTPGPGPGGRGPAQEGASRGGAGPRPGLRVAGRPPGQGGRGGVGPAGPAPSHSGRCQCRGCLSRRGKLAAQPLGLRQVGSAHLALLVPALTLWVPGRGLAAAPPRAKRSATAAPAGGGRPRLRPAGERHTSSAPGGPPRPSAGAGAGALLRGRSGMAAFKPTPRPPPQAAFDCPAVRRLSRRSGLSPSRPGTFARPGLPRPPPPPLGPIQGPGYAPSPGPPDLGAGRRPAILKYVSRKTSYHPV